MNTLTFNPALYHTIYSNNHTHSNWTKDDTKIALSIFILFNSILIISWICSIIRVLIQNRRFNYWNLRDEYGINLFIDFMCLTLNLIYLLSFLGYQIYKLL